MSGVVAMGYLLAGNCFEKSTKQVEESIDILLRLARQREMSYIRVVHNHTEQYDWVSERQGWSPTMPRSKSHQPNSGFTTTSMKLRGEIRDVLLPKITHLDMLKQPVDDLATSRTFYLYVRPLDAVTVKVGVQYRSIHIGSTVAEIHLKQSATDLQDVIDALLASLSDGWIWQVS
jgi:hypothetical protein